MATFDHDSSIREFKAKVQSYTKPAVCGRSYVLVSKLIQWLRSPVNAGTETTQISRLLFAAFRDRRFLPIAPETCSIGDRSCLLVFSVLLEIGFGHLVHAFQRLDIIDKHLPTSLLTLREKLYDRKDIPDGDKLATVFDQAQWRFCPAKFELHVGEDFVEHRILPICKKDKINNKGGTAKLWQIEVQEEFIGPKLKDAVSNSRFNVGPSPQEEDWVSQAWFPDLFCFPYVVHNGLPLASVINSPSRLSRWVTKLFMTMKRKLLMDFEIALG